MVEKNPTQLEAALADWRRIIDVYHPLHVRYPHGELIFQAGAYAAGAYLVSAGLVSDRSPAGEGRRTPAMEILGPGDLIGLEPLLDKRRDLHLSCARAVTDAELFFFERDLFLQVLETEPEIERYCLSGLARRLYLLKQRTGQLFTSRVEERLGRLLLDLAEECGRELEGDRLALPAEITLPIVAQLLGRSVTRVGRALDLLPGVSREGASLVVSLGGLRETVAGCAGEETP